MTPISAITYDTNLAHICVMSEKSQNPDVSELFRIVDSFRPDGLSDRDWAKKAGVSRAAIYNLKIGKVPRSDNLERILDAVGVTLAQFEAAKGGRIVEQREPARDVQLREPPVPFRPRELPRDVPVYGTAQGHDLSRNGDHPITVATTTYEPGDVVDYLRRPPVLVGRDDVYGLYIVGDSMSPRYEQGEPIYVDPRRPASLGDYVIVQLMRHDEEGSEFVTAVIKRLIRRTANYIELEQFQPAGIFRLDIREVGAVHRVMTPSDLMAV